MDAERIDDGHEVSYNTEQLTGAGSLAEGAAEAAPEVTPTLGRSARLFVGERGSTPGFRGVAEQGSQR
jgi:hypothetical protein